MVCLTRTTLMMAVVALGAVPVLVVAQGRMQPMLVEDGETRSWPEEWPEIPLSPDSMAASSREIIRQYQIRGYWYAMVDSIISTVGEQPAFFVSRGRPSRIGTFHVGIVDDSLASTGGGWPEPGDRADQSRLAARLNQLLEAYNDEGYPLATGTIRIERTAQEDVVDVVVVLERGAGVVLTSVELAEEVRTKPRLVARLAGLRLGGRVTSFDAEAVRRRLSASGLFDEVGEVRLEADALGNGTLTVPLVESDPGNFDLVLGYQSNPGGKGELVGNGHIALSNVFGGARTVSMRLNRLSGRSSIVEADLVDPYVLGSALGAGVSFEGEQRDSTFSKQSYGGEVGYQLTSALGVFGSVDRSLARPGQVGLSIVGGRQLIPRSASVFAGIGVRYTNVDRPSNPRRGIDVSTQFERGRKSIRTRLVTGADTTTQRESIRQERLFARARLYTPVFATQVTALGLDAEALLSDVYDEADLLSLGGATSLRGYNERQFTGRFVARALAEYRYLLDRDSYAFIFADVGYVEPVRQEGVSRGSFHPGFGLGVQFRAAIGLINATYAVNSTDGLAQGKVHVGLSFAL